MEYNANAAVPTTTQFRITLLAKMITVDSPLSTNIYQNRYLCWLMHTVRAAVIGIG